MDASEIEQFAQAMKNLTPEDLKRATAMGGPDVVAKMQAAVAAYDLAVEDAGEEIAQEAEKHLRGED